ncbi:MAG TPA: hypothetical protein DEQ09_09295 [Bacteroidales bacterium]|nr:hypothetical protein [Bacteroidales bacterium]
MQEVDFHSPDYYPDCGLKYVIIGARYKDKWVFIKNKLRKGYELPSQLSFPYVQMVLFSYLQDYYKNQI